MYVISEADYLAHHGVMGMHWGVRKPEVTGNGKVTNSPKSEPSDKKHLTPEQRQTLIKVGMGITIGAAVVGGLLLTHGHIKVNEELKALDAYKDGGMYVRASIINDTKLPKDTDFYRVAKKLETSIDAPKYTTYTPRDVSRYRGLWFGNFSTEFKALSDVNIASVKTQVNALADVIDEPLSDGTSIRKKLEKVATNKYAVKAIKRASPETLGFVAYDDRVGGAWTDAGSKAMINKLLSTGYSGLTDGFDTELIADHAVVLFDDAIFRTTGTSLSAEEKILAQNKFFTEFGDRNYQ